MIQKLFDSNKYKIKDVPADGHCLFYVIYAAMMGGPSIPEEIAYLRTIVADAATGNQLKYNRTLYKAIFESGWDNKEEKLEYEYLKPFKNITTLEEYRRYLSSCNYWGDDVAISELETRLHIN